MIKKMIIRNFRCHADTELAFSKGVNVIVGENDAGKSTILKALNWVVNNRPLGDGFIRTGEKDVLVALSICKDGKDFQVIRSKSDKDNFYDLSSKGLAPFVARAFGSHVPEEITGVLNIDEVNIQKQLRPYFLVLDPPGQVAIYMRETTGLDKIDKIVSKLNGKIKAASSSIDLAQLELNSVERKLQKVQDIDLKRFSECIEAYEIVEKRKEDYVSAIEGLSSVICSLKGIEVIVLPDNIDKLIAESAKDVCKYEQVKKEFDDLNSILESIEDVNLSLINYSNIPIDFEKDVDEANNVVTEYKGYNEKILVLRRVIDGLKEVETFLSECEWDLGKLNEHKLLLLEKLDECPSCGQKLTVDAKKKLLGLERVG